MAKPKYKNDGSLSPTEFRKIQEEIDELQHKRSMKGVKISKKRIENTFGCSSTEYKKKRKPKGVKPRIHDVTRYTSKRENKFDPL
ncbi:hypothetical protein GNZ01_06975 [Escherichia coli]|uniref:Uncharacterized protein n=5 Tax=root TaxID=1 RepID=A0AAJ3CVA2_ECOLX|nr:hypothetical protein [Escherichia coli]YP_009102026.1 hypothetical protein PBI_121Q_439 [Escherichia phage 121Q]YP_009150442.1 hypothetical protein ACQ29_gp128 [Escherichia phage PBECO4]MED6536344.1 hypothetical protein [Escherichia coli O157]QBO61975.1 hypothetical protein G17_00486 [Escherichia phage vB_EcoM_G17]QDF13999.1 hypothetical protein vBEcoMphAPEC6_gp375c [Escherichia phage vB_EcoM_phAPEC6]QXN76158.1 hypothetical protein [Escherichia phage BF17]WIL00691.1 hypothetical protein [